MCSDGKNAVQTSGNNQQLRKTKLKWRQNFFTSTRIIFACINTLHDIAETNGEFISCLSRYRWNSRHACRHVSYTVPQQRDWLENKKVPIYFNLFFLVMIKLNSHIYNKWGITSFEMWPAYKLKFSGVFGYLFLV